MVLELGKGEKIFPQNEGKVLNIVMKTQPRIVDFKGSINKRFDQDNFIR